MKIAQHALFAIIAFYAANFFLNQPLSIIVTESIAAEAAQISKLLERLSASDKALKNARSDFQNQQQLGQLGASEVIDFYGYLSQLQKQVSKDCSALKGAGYDISQQRPCDGQNTASQPSEAEQANEQTRGDKVSQQNSQLSKELGEFDEMMLQEQARVKAAAPPGSNGQAGGQSGGGQSGQAQNANLNSGQAGAGAQPQGEVSTEASAPGAGAEKTVRTERFPEPVDTPNGSDDDLVARQLREAAEQEADPALRARLWDEYKKYKQGI